eukprot:COSAG02_NODE_123_length_35269_cov_51.697526_19_plen_81_part_00
MDSSPHRPVFLITILLAWRRYDGGEEEKCGDAGGGAMGDEALQVPPALKQNKAVPILLTVRSILFLSCGRQGEGGKEGER